MPSLLLQSLKLNGTSDETQVKESFRDAHVLTNDRLSSSDIDDMYSGTTAISVYCDHGKLYVSNVGDSRTMLGAASDDGHIEAKALSFDHTPRATGVEPRARARASVGPRSRSPFAGTARTSGSASRRRAPES